MTWLVVWLVGWTQMTGVGSTVIRLNFSTYGRLSLNGHLYKTDTSVKRTLKVGPCLSLLPLFDSL